MGSNPIFPIRLKVQTQVNFKMERTEVYILERHFNGENVFWGVYATRELAVKCAKEYFKQERTIAVDKGIFIEDPDDDKKYFSVCKETVKN